MVDLMHRIHWMIFATARLWGQADLLCDQYTQTVLVIKGAHVKVFGVTIPKRLATVSNVFNA